MAADKVVVVIAGSMENLDALARLIQLLPVGFPVPLVAQVHGLNDACVAQLAQKAQSSPARLNLVVITNNDERRAGCLFMAPAAQALVFAAPGLLKSIADVGPKARGPAADRLFESAARFHGSMVVAVVLGGQGSDGTQGLLAVTEAGGTRVVQSPSEAVFSAMPSSALLYDHVEHSVMLDQMGELLAHLVNASHTLGV